MSAPTPAELRELAARARSLAVEITAMHSRFDAAPDEPTRRAGWRLDETAGAAQSARRDLEETAQDLVRIRGRSTCGADWGVCPEHGNTLTSSGGECWCREPGCGRRWTYDRSGLPCTEPAVYDVRDATGGGGPMCAGHARDAVNRLDDGTVTEL